MKSYETRKADAESVLECVGKTIKITCSTVITADGVSGVSNLVDSYTKLYEEIQK